MTFPRSVPAVTLRKPLERAIRTGHPWVFRDALAPAPSLPEGALVLVRGRDRRPLALGFWDRTSAIAVRVIAADAQVPAAAIVDQKLRDTLRGRLARLDRAQTNAFRWVHGEADGLPGIHVDLYDDVAAVRYDGAGARAFYGDLGQRLIAAAASITAGPPGLRAVIDREGRRLLAGQPVAEREVLENGLRFGVDLLTGQKGGLFLDQRENRQEVRARAAGKSVLNLFGYTGGFSIYAAAGGARRTDTVDSARPALAAARGNFERNGLALANAGLHAEDAFAFLTAAAAGGQTWDLVISDPPSFAPRKSAVPAARKAYRRLHRLCAAVTAPGGTFCPASCSSHFPADEFLASINEGVAGAGRRFSLEHLRGAAFDHPVVPSFPEGDYLKFAVGRVTRGESRSSNL
jgi:23S rRNA (cytosine1962-C5)-methyltransferase